MIVGDSSPNTAVPQFIRYGNVIDKVTQNGIYIGGSSKRTIKGVTVSGNRVNASGQSAVLTDWCSESTVSKNKLYQISGKQNNGVYLRKAAMPIRFRKYDKDGGQATEYGLQNRTETQCQKQGFAVQRNGVYLKNAEKHSSKKQYGLGHGQERRRGRKDGQRPDYGQ